MGRGKKYQPEQVVNLLRQIEVAVANGKTTNNNRMRRRIWVGRKDDGAAIVSLMDADGKKRIVMQVAADGTPSLDFLDADGHIVKRVLSGN